MNIRKLFFAWGITVVTGILTLPVYADLVIADNGSSDFVIEIDPRASAPEQNAARELQTYLQAISGVELPIVSSLPEGKHAIVVGRGERARQLLGNAVDLDALKDDTTVIYECGNDLVLSGDAPRGTLYAVYSFLEDWLGVRFWTSTETDIPQQTRIQIPTIQEVYTPPFFNRETFYKPFLDDPLFSVRRKVNGHWEEIPEEWGGHLDLFGWCHTGNLYLPPEKYFQDHPEWYCMRDGKRQIGQPCLTNREMRAEYIRNVFNALQENPGQRVLDISQNDNYLFCQCPECEAFVREHGNQTDLLLDFVNEVATEVGKNYPDLTVMTLAYQYTRQLPETVRPVDNVCIRLCSIECDFGYPLRSERNADMAEEFRQWSAIAGQLAVWNYLTNFPNYMLPHPNIESLADDIRFFRENHAVSVFNQGDVGTGYAGDYIALRGYIVSKLLWNPDLDEKVLFQEFLDGYYGNAAPFIKEYWDLILKEFHAAGTPLRCGTGDAPWLSPQTIVTAREIMDKAENAVAENDTLLQRVRTARLTIDFALLNLFRVNAPDTAFALFPNMTLKDVNDLYQRSIERAKEAGMVYFAESTPYQVFMDGFELNMTPNRWSVEEVTELLKDPEKHKETMVIIGGKELQLHGEGELSARIVDAAAPFDGYAGTLPGTDPAGAVQAQIGEYNLPGNYEAFVMARPATEGANIGAAMTAGAYDPATGINRVVNLSLASDGKTYQLYSIGRCKPSGKTYLYCAASNNVPVAIAGFVLVKSKDIP